MMLIVMLLGALHLRTHAYLPGETKAASRDERDTDESKNTALYEYSFLASMGPTLLLTTMAHGVTAPLGVRYQFHSISL